MTGVLVATDQGTTDIQEDVPVSELIQIFKSTICSLSNEEVRTMHIRKNLQPHNPEETVGPHSLRGTDQEHQQGQTDEIHES